MLAKCIVLTLLSIYRCQAAINGHEALPHQHPYQVAIYSRIPVIGKEHLICGGVILAPSWILTSAQCIPKFKFLSVRAGKHDLSVKETGQQVRDVERSFKHEDYKAPCLFRKIAQNDIALLKLVEPLTLSEHIQLIALPKSGAQHTGMGVLSGWGRVANKGTPDSLQSVQVSFLDSGKCAKVIRMFYRFATINSDHVCTGSVSGQLSACSTDLGGPVIQYQADASPQLAGIVSWAAVPCRAEGIPIVYTRVSSYVNWIQEMLEIE